MGIGGMANKLLKPGEDEEINHKLKVCHATYKNQGKNGLILMVIKLFIEVRRLSIALEKLKNETDKDKGDS